MKRRDFSGWMLAYGAVGSLAALQPAQAQQGLQGQQGGAPKEGIDYVTLSTRQPTEAKDKIEVTEFFWYGCPHCNNFEPTLEAWGQKLPRDVVLRRVPIAFREAFVPHQRIYYALETLGQVEALHRKVYYAIHVDRNPLTAPEAIADFMQKNGVDRAKFMQAYNSFGVQTKVQRAKQLGEAYKIDGVPAMGVNGRYWTSGSLAGSMERSLQVVDYLIAQERKAKR